MSQESLTHPKNYQRVSSSLQQASTELPSAYCELEKCVEDLSRELSESDSARARQRADKEVGAAWRRRGTGRLGERAGL